MQTAHGGLFFISKKRRLACNFDMLPLKFRFYTKHWGKDKKR